MSVNVLIIPEDFRKDQHVLKPIIEKMMASIGVRARVRVCMDPKLGGIGAALKWEHMQKIVNRYRGMTRVFLLIVDRDCDENRRAKLDTLEQKAETLLAGTDCYFLAENAWQELEVWVLAGMSDLPKDWHWQEIRQECDPKENYYVPYARQRNVDKDPHAGREPLAKKAATNYLRIRRLCPEDVATLETRIRVVLGTG
ncbi:hypothetical protein [Candidatus Thiosymbion oneisti]|uniref:hypothetical protein n=1 Tax=Candidatus Thiosymbion oneisti TaxID=589554 RepID=UPI0010609171|nr:hypothetical protein [Candidatus Thiosymbion oneisti]